MSYEQFYGVSIPQTALPLLTISLIFGVSAWGLYTLVFHNSQPDPVDAPLAIISGSGFLLGLLFILVTMQTEITDKSIIVRFFPFAIVKKISWDKIQQIEVRKYDWLYESGGSGRFGVRHGRNGIIGYFLRGTLEYGLKPVTIRSSLLERKSLKQFQA